MTEYKKLVTLADTLARDVQALENATPDGGVSEDFADADLPGLEALASRIKDTITDGTPRMRKIALKAREADPNKQIYNEAMCEKIETLFRSYCDALTRLYPSLCTSQSTSAEVAHNEETTETAQHSNARGDPIATAILAPEPSSTEAEARGEDPFAFENAPRLEAVENAHNAYMLRTAEAEAWQTRVAMKLDDAALFEEQGRAVLLAEEKVARATLAEDKRRDKLRIQTMLHEQEEARWHAEEARRKTEHANLRDAAAQVTPSSCDTVIQTSIPPEFRQALARHLYGLVRALVATPEDMNIRKLRNSNAQYLRDFGGISLATGSEASSESCVCSHFARTSEVLLYRMGYRVRYTGTGTPSPVFLVSDGVIDDVLLPCGKPVSQHRYTPLGFEDYSERYLELTEPDAMHNPDAWMVWYTSLQDMETALKTLT